MMRPFDWRDVALVRQLSETGLCLDTQTGLVEGVHPLQNALLHYLMPGAGRPTFIHRAPASNATTVFGQLRHRAGRPQARLMFIAPRPPEAGAEWGALLDQLARTAGERGAHNLLAEINEAEPEFEQLRHSGFAIYARHSLWQLPADRALPTTNLHPAVRPATSADAFAITTLYTNIVPRLLQQVEQPPHHIERGYVLQQHQELIAYMEVRRGPLGLWLKPYLHPEAYDVSEAVLLASLAQIANRAARPIYVCIPRYEDGLQSIIAHAGFENLGTQALMVKRLTARVTEPFRKPLPVVEGQATTPAVRTQIHPDWLAHYAKTNHRRFTRPDGRASQPHRRSPQPRQSQ